MLTRVSEKISFLSLVSVVLLSSQGAFCAETEQGDSIDLNDNLTRFVLSLGCRETGFNKKEASHDLNNRASNNRNVRVLVAKGVSEKEAMKIAGDYGYFQCNQNDVNDAQNLGLEPEVASALNNGQNKGQYTLAQQTRAVIQYIKKSPALKKGAEAAERQDWKTANRLLNKKWPSLPGGGSHKSHLDANCNQYLAGKDPLNALSTDRAPASIEQAAQSIDELFSDVKPSGNTNSSESDARYSYRKMNPTGSSEGRVAQNTSVARGNSAR
ncbi:MAG: hypothetical protein KGQ59_05580 [Bdellovibrionales bacterium]|nr:hypothetical protein [Bdellovibrionales bacterium]